jgi:hypothetical protein
VSYYDDQPLDRKCAMALQYSRNYVKAFPVASAAEEHITGLCDLVQELRAALPEWRPIDTAPMDGSDVLLYGQRVDGFTCSRAIGHWNGQSWRNDDYVLHPTHWMPLAAAPEVPRG